ncbi:hypothetical protein ACFHW2_42865 [Actinomadura sp. LOL_016]|uniref:hypothetical protein n=1 Tax=unclassified Actinomadura TaxID=2626254 RepID=UPI003A7F7C8C
MLFKDLPVRCHQDHGHVQLAARPTGPKPRKSEADRANDKLAAENARLADELARTKKALAIMGKAHELLELLSESEDSDSGPGK